MRVVTIIYWAAGWLSGIWLGSFLALPTVLWAVVGLVGLVSAVFLRRKPLPFALAVALSAVALGAARYNISQPLIDQDHIAFYNGAEDVLVSGLVVKAPDIHETYQNLTLESETLALADGSQQTVEGRILVRAARSPVIEYGTRIQAAGRLEEPGNFGTFDYRGYLARRDIYTAMDRPAITVVATQAGSPLLQGLLVLRKQAQESINHLLPQPQAALLSGILLGDDHAIPKDLQEDFRATGMSHVIAISGFNIAIIAGALLVGGRQVLGIRIAAWIAILAVIAYTIFVGAEASVVRAAAMSILMILAVTMLGRPTYLPAVLVGAAFFMTLLNPNILWDVGFQLSFAATLGLTLYLGPWSHSFHNFIQPVAGDSIAKTSTRFVSDVVLATFAATIMTFPLMIFHFDTISLVNPLANLLILPAQPGIMTWGGLATVAGMISPALGQFPAWIAWLFLSYTIALVEFFGSLSFASFPVNMPAFFLVGGYGIIFAATAIGRSTIDDGDSDSKRRINGRVLKVLLVGLLLFILLSAVWLWQRPDGKLHVSFLDVGQGDAILIETPDGRQMLVDGGEYPSLLLSRLGEQLPFWDKQIDVVVATHPDIDHVAGMADLFANYKVGQVITNGADSENVAHSRSFIQAAQRSRTPIRTGQPGEVIELGSEVTVEVLQAGGAAENSGDNNESVILRLVYEDFSLLLTGDAEHIAEQTLLRNQEELQSTVLKAGHHGSRTASNRLFLQAVNPQIVIISAGQDNRFGHPHQEALQRIAETGATILRTDESGTIELVSDGKQIWMHVEHE